jgi:hypothetical protein
MINSGYWYQSTFQLCDNNGKVIMGSSGIPLQLITGTPIENIELLSYDVEAKNSVTCTLDAKDYENPKTEYDGYYVYNISIRAEIEKNQALGNDTVKIDNIELAVTTNDRYIVKQENKPTFFDIYYEKGETMTISSYTVQASQACFLVSSTESVVVKSLYLHGRNLTLDTEKLTIDLQNLNIQIEAGGSATLGDYEAKAIVSNQNIKDYDYVNDYFVVTYTQLGSDELIVQPLMFAQVSQTFGGNAGRLYLYEEIINNL